MWHLKYLKKIDQSFLVVLFAQNIIVVEQVCIRWLHLIYLFNSYTYISLGISLY